MKQLSLQERCAVHQLHEVTFPVFEKLKECGNTDSQATKIMCDLIKAWTSTTLP